MKLQIIDTYQKSTVIKNDAGLPIKDEHGRVKKVTRTNFLYGVVGATPEEKALYKRFKMQDGTNYYSEQQGVPLYFSATFIGRSATLKHFEREDGRIGFKVNTMELDILDEMIAKTSDPMLRAGYEAKKAELLLAGGTLVLENKSQQQVENEARQDEPVLTDNGADDDDL